MNSCVESVTCSCRNLHKIASVNCPQVYTLRICSTQVCRITNVAIPVLWWLGCVKNYFKTQLMEWNSYNSVNLVPCSYHDGYGPRHANDPINSRFGHTEPMCLLLCPFLCGENLLLISRFSNIPIWWKSTYQASYNINHYKLGLKTQLNHTRWTRKSIAQATSTSFLIWTFT